jgi:hypothetical protein
MAAMKDLEIASSPSSSTPIRSAIFSRIADFDWHEIEASLAERGHARMPGLLSPSECQELVGLYAVDDSFRSTIDMQQHRFGVGEYRYFSNPLPALVRTLRTALYPRLRQIANHWQEQLNQDERYPARLSTFLAECRERGQTRPTPLLLRYEANGYNCLHQDVYGEVAFPLQVACLLSRPGSQLPGAAGGNAECDFSGGEFLLTEQRPRMQSRGEALVLSQGEALVFPNRNRPVEGTRGVYRATVRHGVSRVHGGERYTLGLIFHDAE